MLLKILLKNIQTGRSFAQLAVVTSKRNMQTKYSDYVRFMELVGNVKVSKIFYRDLDRRMKIKRKTFSRSSRHDMCDDDTRHMNHLRQASNC